MTLKVLISFFIHLTNLSLNNSQLNEIQHQVMMELVNYYTKCQELYDSAFSSLAKALENQ